MSRFPKPPGNDPARLEFEAQLDLLVDDELPEDSRAALLRSLSEAPHRWRLLAQRFLERQAERKAVKQFITGNSLHHGHSDLPANYPFHSRRPSFWVIARNVAAVFIIGALGVFGGIHYGTSPAQPNNLAAANFASSSIPINLPASVVGDRVGKIPVDVPLLTQSQTPAGYPFAFADNPAGAKQHIVMVPLSDNRVMVFPVTTDSSEIH